MNSLAAVVIQAHWRGYIVRKKIQFSAKLHTDTAALLPNSYIKNQSVLKKEKRKSTVNTQEQRKKAAILIQVIFLLVCLFVFGNVVVKGELVILH